MSRRQLVGRYVIGPVIGEGGSAIVYVGRLLGPEGFGRTVAIKRLRTDRADALLDLLDEARVASRAIHPNVVSVIDVVKDDAGPCLVMEYVHGESLGPVLAASGAPVPAPIAVAIVRDVLRGLGAAHEAKDSHGAPLHIVHRDVSTRNILIGADGVSRIADFGVAKAVGSTVRTATGVLRGTIRYMSPEHVRGESLTAQADVFSVGAVLWEMLTGRPLFAADNDAQTIYAILERPIEPPSQFASDVPPMLDETVLRSLERAPASRFVGAEEMAAALEAAVTPASARYVSEWLEDLCGEALAERLELVRALEREPSLPTADVRARSGPSVTRSALVVLAALGAVGALGALAIAARAHRERETPAAAAISFSPPPPASPPDQSPASLAAAIPSASAPASPIASTATSMASRATPKTPAVAGMRKPDGRPAATASTRERRARDCNPPYRVNAEGITVFKEDCL